jgi:ketosteroid isomerase-like protein
MARSRHLVSVLLLVTACAPAPREATTTPAPVLRAELFAARDAVWRAYFAGDTAALTRILPAEMPGMGQDRAGIIADAQAFAREGGRLVTITFSDDEFYVQGDVAVLWSRYRVDLTGPEGPQVMEGRAIELFARQEGRWINPSWHLHRPE